METTRQWLERQRFGIQRLYLRDLAFLLDAPCNEVLDAERPRRPFYVDAERKTQAPDNYKLGHVPVHGIDAWKLDRFRDAGAPVWLVIASAKEAELLALAIADHLPDDVWGSKMVYWRRSRFAKIADLSGAKRKPEQLGFGDFPA